MQTTSISRRDALGQSGKRLLQRIIKQRETTILLITIGICVALSLSTPYFLTKPNLSTTAIGMAGDGIMVCGMLMAIVTAGGSLGRVGAWLNRGHVARPVQICAH